MNNEVANIWNLVQGHLLKEMKGPSFQTWIKPSKLIEVNENKAIIAVKNEFNKNFLKQCYIGKITSAIEKTIKKTIEVEIIVKPDLKLDGFISSIANLKENTTVGYFALVFVFLFLIFVIVGKRRKRLSSRKTAREKGREIILKRDETKKDDFVRARKEDVEYVLNKIKQESIEKNKPSEKGNPFDIFN